MAKTRTDPDDIEGVTDGRMSLVEHLTELRDRLIKCVVAVAIGMLLGWILYPWIFETLLDPYCSTLADDVPCRLQQIEPLEGFSVRLKLAGYSGIAFAMPVILWQIWRFVTPGLHPHEKKYAVPFVLSALVLFVLGAGLAYWTLPKAFEFLVQVGGGDLEQAFRPGAYFQLVTYMMLAFGIGFEFPILLIFLQLVGVVTPALLRKWRRYAIVGITVLVAVITPSGDPYSMIVLSVPMILFYEVSILIGVLITRNRAKK
ncbi:MAG TPA: twin-arginine translocase subunit TatC [Acidimicrobiales bacterium]|nr:twin-arginine translocase subunit TatC [Acidimicrobiales bacterium]